MKRRLFLIALTLFLLYNKGASASARAYALMEADSGRILYEQNARERLPMASTTKIMTALLALEKGKLSDQVTVSRAAFGVPGTSIYLSEGETLSLHDMLRGLLLSSGNDAAVAISEHIGGSQDEFCRMMTARARELGCEDTVFLTPHGLPRDGHYTTALDLARIAQAAMENADFRAIVSTQRDTIPWPGRTYDRVLRNKNRLLSDFPGAIGIKTGYTKAAGRCLAFAAEREGMTLIGVVLNCPDWFDEAARLLEKGFSEYEIASLLSKGDPVRVIPVAGGGRAVCVLADDLRAPVRKGEWPSLSIDLPALLPYGARPFDIAGTASLASGGEILLTVPIYIARVERGYTDLLLRETRLWPLL